MEKRKHILSMLLLVASCLFSINAFAEAVESVEIDGIYYNLFLRDKTAEVTINPNKYSGEINIPGKIIYNNVTFSVASIGDNAFDDCEWLNSIAIPNSITTIGEYAFRECYCLTSITIPNSVTSIKAGAFASCTGLTSLIIPNSVTSIGGGAFKDCAGLTTVTIGNSVTNISNNAFNECTGLKKVIVSDIAAWCNISFSGSKANPLYYAGHLYSDETTEITNLVIPNSVKSINDNSFNNCKGLTSVTIGNSVASIGWYAFEDCSGLTSVNIPNSVKSIGWYAFEDCSGLTSITIPNSVKSIGDYAFSGCSGLTSVTIPNSVTSIKAGAFSGCSGLTSVTIPNSVTSIGDYAFSDCSGLTSVTIPNSITSIGSSAFYGCHFVKESFINNSTLTSNAYWGATIHDIETDDGLLITDNTVIKCRPWATSVTIPTSVTSISYNAFYGCSGLTSVTISNSVKEIGYKAFAYCKELTDVYCYAENVPSTDSDAFAYSNYKNATLHVPAASIEQYKTTTPWSNFGAIVATDGTTPTPEKCATPTISYSKGELTFSCDTEGAEYVYEITDTDIKKGYAAKVSLTVTYNICVYATKAGYENSDIIQATLCWIEQQPQTEGITDEDAIAEVQAVPILIQTQGNTITVEGAEAGTEIILYGANGVQLDSVIATTGFASLSTSRLSGSVAIVKIGNKTVKVLVKQ